MIANCTMRAPRDGIIVYANRVNGWGTVETQIREGLRVYQSQPIFRLLDPRHMQVRAKINESQVARIRSGQPVLIHLDAFPDRLLRGSVAEIVPIPSLARGPCRTFALSTRPFASSRAVLTHSYRPDRRAGVSGRDAARRDAGAARGDPVGRRPDVCRDRDHHGEWTKLAMESARAGFDQYNVCRGGLRARTR